MDPPAGDNGSTAILAGAHLDHHRDRGRMLFRRDRRGGRGRRIPVVGVVAMALGALSATLVAAPAFAEQSAAATAARQAPLVAGTPCTVTAKSCVDLESKRAWIFDNGKISRGPVTISSGGSGEETPVGHSLRVYRKDQDHTTAEFKLPNGQPAPMPYSVFEDGGIALNGGDPERVSAGCIHLPLADAKAWFADLQVGDQVQVVRASQEYAARKGDANNSAGGDSNDKAKTCGDKKNHGRSQHSK